jgi:hypothetical protein
VAQGVGPEFKPQDCKKRKKERRKKERKTSILEKRANSKYILYTRS